MNHTIDVLVPCYQYGHYLKQCTESILSQSGVDVRILIIDDASPDDSAEVAAELARLDSRIQFHHHQTNMGHIATYNEGIEWASSEFFLLLSADDYLLPGALARACQALTKAPDAAFAFGSAIVEFETGATENVHPLADQRSPSLILDGPAFMILCGARNIVPTPTAVVRTRLQKAVGGYRKDLPHSGDMEMWMRLALRGRVAFVQDYQAVYRRHSSNMSLMYSGEHVMRDLNQRKRALDAVFEGLAATPQSGVIRSALSRDLAYQALKEASAAFNRGNFGLSRDLSHFAQALAPRLELAWPWAKLAFKRTIGPATWQTVRSSKNVLAGWLSKDRQHLQ